jgi:hypothetical protein
MPVIKTKKDLFKILYGAFIYHEDVMDTSKHLWVYIPIIFIHLFY